MKFSEKVGIGPVNKR